MLTIHVAQFLQLSYNNHMPYDQFCDIAILPDQGNQLDVNKSAMQ